MLSPFTVDNNQKTDDKDKVNKVKEINNDNKSNVGIYKLKIKLNSLNFLSLLS